MQVERRQLEGHEYVIVLTPGEAQRLYGALHNAQWDHEICTTLEQKLGAASADALRRFF